MKLKFKELAEKAAKSGRGVYPIMAVGVCGMLLILVSTFWGGNTANSSAPPDEGAVGEESSDSYAGELESRLSGLVAEIEGVGQSRVMVTLQNSGEYVFAQEEKRNIDKTTNPSSQSDGSRIAETENTERKYVLVDGGRQALVTTRLQPDIRGVVVICEGADDVRVQARVVSVVTTALGISSAKVCVEKMKS